MFVVINKEKWDALPNNVKKVFSQVSEEWIEKHGKVWTYYDKAGVDYFLSLDGRELIELPDEEMAKWVEAVSPLIDNYIQEKSAMGLPASDYQEYLIERTKYWSGKSPSEQDCFDWVEKELVK
jgi:TRAP-type C4-dicarboxylate transport system substrate-binding protein